LTYSNAVEASRKSNADEKRGEIIYIKYISILYIYIIYSYDYVTYIGDDIGSVMLVLGEVS
jgi:hypothetical protein